MSARLHTIRGRLATLAAAIALVVPGAASIADERVTRSPNEPHPDAPPETGQWAFMVGDWACKTKFLKPDGSEYAENEAMWSAYFILDGWALQDDWRSMRADGSGTFHGTNIRSFNPELGKWECRWLPQGSLAWGHYEAQLKDDNMVMIGGRGTDARGEHVDRITFHDIQDDSWEWRLDRSYDDGESWNEGIGYISARRVSEAG